MCKDGRFSMFNQVVSIVRYFKSCHFNFVAEIVFPTS